MTFNISARVGCMSSATNNTNPHTLSMMPIACGSSTSGSYGCAFAASSGLAICPASKKGMAGLSCAKIQKLSRIRPQSVASVDKKCRRRQCRHLPSSNLPGVTSTNAAPPAAPSVFASTSTTDEIRPGRNACVNSKPNESTALSARLKCQMWALRVKRSRPTFACCRNDTASMAPNGA